MVPTPRYVLLDGDKPLVTSLVSTEGQSTEKAVFGFSDKPQYDAFRANSNLAYKPYPLVKGYLRGQIDLKQEGVAWVAMDATSPDDANFHACSISQVLATFETDSKTIDSRTFPTATVNS